MITPSKRELLEQFVRQLSEAPSNAAAIVALVTRDETGNRIGTFLAESASPVAFILIAEMLLREAALGFGPETETHRDILAAIDALKLGTPTLTADISIHVPQSARKH